MNKPEVVTCDHDVYQGYGVPAYDLRKDWGFKAWPKIVRDANTTVIITEKLDGTNSCVVITPEGEVKAQSRKRIITPEDDNFGFAKWVKENEDHLKSNLPSGYHYGEWVGPGIQKNPHNLDEKKLYLFDTRHPILPEHKELFDVVPVLYEGSGLCLGLLEVATILEALTTRTIGLNCGSGDTNPEGIIISMFPQNTRLKLHVR